MVATMMIVNHDHPTRKRLIPLLVAAVSLVLIACGDDELTLEQYYAEVGRITEDADKRIQELTADFSGGFESLETAREVYPQYVEAYQDFVDGIAGLNAPTLVADAHRNFLVTSRELQVLNKARREGLNEAEDDSALEEIFGMDEDYAAAVERQNAACVTLRRVAEGRGIPVPGLANCEET